MRILTGRGIREADIRTIEYEGITSLELMERASEEMSRIVCETIPADQPLYFIIGKGNNGGDGLAMARILANAGYACKVTMLYGDNELSEDNLLNYRRLPQSVKVSGRLEYPRSPDTVIVDALLGTGINGDATGTALEAIRWMNDLPNRKVAIDIPSGMKSEFGNTSRDIVQADMTVTVQFPKLAMLLPEAGERCGDIYIADIGIITDTGQNDELFPAPSANIELSSRTTPNSQTGPNPDPHAGTRAGKESGRGHHSCNTDADRCTQSGTGAEWAKDQRPAIRFVQAEDIAPIIKGRGKFSHKGDFGHALVICGSRHMPGAAVLCASAAARSGCGLVTAHVPLAAVTALMSHNPSVMIGHQMPDRFTAAPESPDRFSCIGVGPGLGTHEQTGQALAALMCSYARPMVIDADAINLVAANSELLSAIPEGSVLTPHPGELRRLVGKWGSEEEKISLVKEFACKYNCTLLVKGAYTMVCTAAGDLYFNSTGNPGMAKGGSGDILTGLLTGLIARGYTPEESAVLGAFVHGLAGDKAAAFYGREVVSSPDVIDFIAEAYSELI